MGGLLLPGLLLVSAFCSGCGTGPQSRQARSSDKPVVLAVSYPLASVALRMAGEAIDLHYPLDEEQESPFWMPDEDDVLALQGADLLLLNGSGHEPWEDQVTLSPLNRVVTAQGFRDEWIEMEDAVTHKHGPEGEHTHAGPVPFTWLDPLLFREQVGVVRQSLTKLLPELSEEIEQRAKQILSELQLIHEHWERLGPQLRDIPLIASHPLYHYPARRYGWNLQYELWEPDEDPSEEEWAAFDQLLEKHPAKMMIWEEEPLPETKQKLTARGIRILVFPPLANGTPTDDVISAMANHVAEIEAQLREQQ